MSVKMILSLLVAVLAESLTLVYGLQAISDLETQSGLPVNTPVFATAARFLLFIGTTFVTVITVFAVKRLARN